MTTDQIRYKKLFEFGKKLRSRYLLTLASRKLFDEFNKLSAIKIAGKKNAENNVKIFNSYRYFFLTSKEALRCYFLIELAKFFDEDKRRQSLSIQNTLHYAEEKLESFSTNEFHKYHGDRKILPELFKNFTPLSNKDIDKLKNRLKKNKDTILRLKTYRDTVLAHDDIKKKDILLSAKDINVLLKIVKDTVDMFYQKLDFSVNSYKNYEDDPISEINNLLKALKEHEVQRISDINKKYGIKN